MLLKDFTLDIRCDGRQLVSVEVIKAQASLASLRVRALRGVGLAHACPAAVARAVRFEEEQARRTYMARCFDLDIEAVEAHAKKYGHDATYALMSTGERAAFTGGGLSHGDP